MTDKFDNPYERMADKLGRIAWRKFMSKQDGTECVVIKCGGCCVYYTETVVRAIEDVLAERDHACIKCDAEAEKSSFVSLPTSVAFGSTWW